MTRLRVGIAGGGLVAQAAHLPALRLLASRFEVVALADPSAGIREQVAPAFGIPRAFADWRAMLDVPLDAVLVCTPHASHAEIALAALDTGLHVLVEKPLCIALADADRIVAAQRRAGRVVQVGCMKRFDPAYERLCEALAPGAPVRLIETTTYDPGMAGEPYFAPDGLVRAADVPARVLERGREALLDQLETAFGSRDLDRLGPFATLYLDALVHDVNLVAGVLDALGIADAPEPVHAATWLGGRAASGSWRLPGGARWHASFTYLAGLGRFRERLEVLADDAVHALTFDAPYLQQVPARYDRVTAAEHVRVAAARGAHHGSYAAQLRHFHDCVANGVTCRTPAAMGRRDVELLTRLFEITLEDRTGARVCA